MTMSSGRHPSRALQATWALVALRLLVATVLVFGPWTDEPNELEGWDAARFQQVSESPGDPYRDFDVEYPPGSIGAIEAIAASDVVGTHRRLVVASLIVDLALAVTIRRFWGPNAALAYLALGTPLLPMGLLRFDLWAALAATIGAGLLSRFEHRRTSSPAIIGFAIAVVAGAFIKLWPAFLIPAAFAAGHKRSALVAATAGLGAGAAWLAISGTGALSQVLSLRGATGWHLESVPGSITALFTDATPRKEADAFRIGTLRPWLVSVARIGALAATAALVAIAARRQQEPQPGSTALARSDVLPLLMLGSISALIVSAPLISPQFLLWLTPWAAMLPFAANRRLVILTGATIAITGVTLAAFGPPNLDHPLAAALLLVRAVGLVGIIGLSARALLSPTRSAGEGSTRLASG